MLAVTKLPLLLHCNSKNKTEHHLPFIYHTFTMSVDATLSTLYPYYLGTLEPESSITIPYVILNMGKNYGAKELHNWCIGATISNSMMPSEIALAPLKINSKAPLSP